MSFYSGGNSFFTLGMRNNLVDFDRPALRQQLTASTANGTDAPTVGLLSGRRLASELTSYVGADHRSFTTNSVNAGSTFPLDRVWRIGGDSVPSEVGNETSQTINFVAGGKDFAEADQLMFNGFTNTLMSNF